MRASRKVRKGRKEGMKLCSKATASFFRHSIRNAFDAVFQPQFAEVYQQTETTVAQAELCEHLLAVNRDEFLHGLQLHNDFALNYQVGAEAFVEGQFIVANGNRHLTFGREALFSEFVGEDNLIDRFEQTRPKPCMNLERGVENDPGDFVFVEGSGCVYRRSEWSAEAAASSSASRKVRQGRRGINLLGRQRVRNFFSNFAPFGTFA